MMDQGGEAAPRSKGVPLPIQIFLWRQIDPFLRGKTGKLYDASCVSFEHVLVENSLRCLPPSLSVAIEKITRWQLIDACLPHIMHCAALLVANRNKLGQADKFDVPATKLLHTLHWVFLESSKVCNLDGKSSNCNIALDDVTHFIHLFAPIASNIKQTDLTFRLSSGQRIWRPMWNYEQPHIPSFMATIAPPRDESSNAEGDCKCSTRTESNAKPVQVTVCDVAVLNCLMYRRWSEDGVLWGITYILKKMQSYMKQDTSTSSRIQRRCNSLINRRRSVKSAKSMKILPPQKESSKEDAKAEVEVELTKNAHDVTDGQDAQRKHSQRKSSHFFKFRQRRSFQCGMPKTSQTSPITKRKQRIRNFASISAHRFTMSSKLAAKHASFRKRFLASADEPPSYSSVTSGNTSMYLSPVVNDRNGRKLSADRYTETSMAANAEQGDSPASPPVYSQTDTGSEDQIEIVFQCTSDESAVGETSKKEDLPQPSSAKEHKDTFNENLLTRRRRWTSDTCLTYEPPKHETTPMASSKYVDTDGSLRVDVVLSVVEVIISRSPGLRVTDVCLQVLDCVRQRQTSQKHNKAHNVDEQETSDEDKTIGIFLRILHGLTRLLGCANGCNKSGHRTTASDRMRSMTRCMMTSVFSTHRESVRKYIKHVVQSQPLADVMDFLHPLLSYCTVDINSCVVKEVNDEVLCADAEGVNILEDIVVKITFRELVNKCLYSYCDIYKKDSKELYSEIRNIVQFVRLKHPSTFNRVLLSVMLIPKRKREKWIKEQGKMKEQEKRTDNFQSYCKRRVRRGAVDHTSSPFTNVKWPDKGLHVKAGRSRDLFDTTSICTKTSFCGQELSDDEDATQNRDYRERNPSLFDKMHLGRINYIVGTMISGHSDGSFKAKTSFLGEDVIECDEGSDYESSAATFLTRIRKKKNARKQGKENDPGGLSSNFKISLLPFLHLSESSIRVKKNAEFEVDMEDIHHGLRIIEFLMDCCPPGTVPDASVLGSVMGLSSPIISRCVVLLQCAQFIDRCANGSWPHWMRDRTRQYKRCHKNAKLYMTAGKLFHKWGEAISRYLEKVISYNNDPTTVLGQVRTDEEKLRNRNEDLCEDFTKDIRVNESGKSCTIAVQMSAANVLHQITAFVRDVYPHLPQHENFLTKDPATESAPGLTVISPTKSHHDSPCKKTIKFSSACDFQSQSFLSPHPTTPRRASAQPSGTRDQDEFKTAAPRRGSAIVDGNQSTRKNHNLSCGPHSVGSSNNTLAVPASNIYIGGNFSPFSSCSGLSFGSTMSLSATSVTSEYTGTCKDATDSTIQTNSTAHIASNSAFAFGAAQRSDSNTWTEELPWLKVMLHLANQRNFVCDHASYCHPYCHRRISRSCNRLVASICNLLTKYEKDAAALKPQTNSQIKPVRLVRYLKTKVACLSRSPFLVLLKSITLLTNEMLIDLHALCWEILLDSNKPTAEAAASLFLLCGIKMPQEIHMGVISEISHPDPAQRIFALRKIRVLWEQRNCVWKNAESKARRTFKVQAATSNFSLSLSSLGLEAPIIPDPPWVPHIVNVDEIVAQSGSSVQSAAILATDTLSHYKELELKQLMHREEDQRASARKNFHITGFPVIQQIAVDLKKKGNDEVDDDVTAINRRQSSRLLSTGSSNMSTLEHRRDDFRNQSRTAILCSRIYHADSSSQDLQHFTMLPNFAVFPPCLAVCVPAIIQAVLDVTTTKDGESVGDMARFVVTNCMIEDSNLFLRSIGDKLSDKHDYHCAMWILRKLPSILLGLSPSVAQPLFNQLIETVLHYNRTTTIREPIIAPCVFAMSSIVPYVQALDMKTFKQTLRKEQIDIQLLITAGMPGTKKLTVWNQGDFYMPTQVDVGDESSFDIIVHEAIASTDVQESEQFQYQLVDGRTDQIACRHCYVRDFYMFRKTVFPELTLVKMTREEGDKRMAQRVVDLKLAEIGRLRLAISVLSSEQNAVDKEFNATFIQDELKKLWSFPRKAIDAEFFMFDTKYADEIRNLDVIQKFYWMDLISTMLLSLSSEFPWENDLIFFMHVWSGALVVHCEQAPLLRRFTAAVIDVVVHFSHSFTLHGYSLVLPTMLKIYSKHYNNRTVRLSLELVFKQMFQVHRQPFLLLLFASAAPLLSEYSWQQMTDGNENDEQVSHTNFFQLLLALINPREKDGLHVLSLVQAQMPLKPVDECLETDETSITFGDYFKLCITVIAYQPENSRTLEMLIVMNSLLPCYFRYMEKTMKSADELAQIMELSVYIRSLLSSVEVLTRTINSSLQPQQPPQLQPQQPKPKLQTSQNANASRKGENVPEESGTKEGGEKEEAAEKKQTAEEFVAPRDVILQLCTSFYTNACHRISRLKRSHTEDILNTKSHVRLAEIAQSLLKLLTDESVPTVSMGLACYVKHMLPIVKWSVEAIRPALFIVLKRLDRFFGKISKIYSFRRALDWRTVAMMVNGLCDLLARQPLVTHIPHLRTFVNMSVTMQIGSNYLTSNDPATLCQCNLRTNLSPALTPHVVKLMVLQSQGAEGVSLEEMLKPLITNEKRENLFLNLIIPICICAAAEHPVQNQQPQDERHILKFQLTATDIRYIVNLCLNSLMGKGKSTGENIMQLFLATSPLSHRNNNIGQKVALFALKIVIACFHKQLHREWHALAIEIKDITLKNMNVHLGPAMWSFIVFVMRYKTPLLAHLKPFVVRQFMSRSIDNVEELDQKQILAHILARNKHQTIQPSLMIDGFVKEARKLRQQSQSGKTPKLSASPNYSFGISKSPISSTDVTVKLDRSRIASFRKAVTPSDSSDLPSEALIESPVPAGNIVSTIPAKRASASAVWNHIRNRTSPVNRRPSKVSSYDDIGQIRTPSGLSSSPLRSQTVPYALWKESDVAKIPDITIDLCESPYNSPLTKSKQTNLAATDRKGMQTGSSNTKRTRRTRTRGLTSSVKSSAQHETQQMKHIEEIDEATEETKPHKSYDHKSYLTENDENLCSETEKADE